jgi:alpha-methylacyl-CoA racemase
LVGVRVVEFAGLGPGPFCAMMLSDMGAEVLRIDRKGTPIRREPKYEVMNRGRRSVALNLKSAEGMETALKLIERADALIEGFRPGVMERLGLGPETARARNPKLVYGRMTGWGQDGPLKDAAGHDINYIALTGVLEAIGTKSGGPVPPLNLIGDFGGGGMFLAFGLVCGILEARSSGKGQVVDAAMTDGASVLMAAIHGLRAWDFWTDERESNWLDGGAPYYGTYECSDRKWICVGSLEPQFYALLREKTGLADDPWFDDQMRRGEWPAQKARLAEIFRAKTRAEWCEIMEGTDVCFAPVLSMAEALEHPHNKARGTFVEVDGVPQPAPAPRFSRTPPAPPEAPVAPGHHNGPALADWGFSEDEIAALKQADAL